MESTGWLFSPLFPGRIGIWKCWFLWREENRSTRRKTLGAGTRTNNKLNPHMTPSPGIEPGPHWREASALTTAPSLLPLFSSAHFFSSVHEQQLKNREIARLAFMYRRHNLTIPSLPSCAILYPTGSEILTFFIRLKRAKGIFI